MTTIYFANALKTTERVANGCVILRHFWYHSPYFFDQDSAIQHCMYMLKKSPKLKGYHFTHVTEYTVF